MVHIMCKSTETLPERLKLPYGIDDIAQRLKAEGLEPSPRMSQSRKNLLELQELQEPSRHYHSSFRGHELVHS